MLNIDEFLNYIKYELNRSERTVESYSEDLRLFQNYFKNLSDTLSWETVDSDIIRNWMESMMDKGNKVSSVSRRLSAIKTFYRYALLKHQVMRDPANGILTPKKEKPLPQFLRENEMEDLLECQAWKNDYEDVRARTIILVFYETGIRLSELVGLDDKSVDFEKKQIKVLGKGNKERIVPFGKELDLALKSYVELRNRDIGRRCAAFFVTDKGAKMQGAAVREIVRKRLSGVCSLRKKTPHVLRHTFATAMLNHHVGIETLKKLLGHASLSTTEIYTHTTFDQLKRVYTEAHPRA